MTLGFTRTVRGRPTRPRSARASSVRRDNLSSSSSATKTRRGTPICGAARPTPGAARMTSTMISTRRAKAGVDRSDASTSRARRRSTVAPTCTIGGEGGSTASQASRSKVIARERLAASRCSAFRCAGSEPRRQSNLASPRPHAGEHADCGPVAGPARVAKPEEGAERETDEAGRECRRGGVRCGRGLTPYRRIAWQLHAGPAAGFSVFLEGERAEVAADAKPNDPNRRGYEADLSARRYAMVLGCAEREHRRLAWCGRHRRLGRGGRRRSRRGVFERRQRHSLHVPGGGHSRYDPPWLLVRRQGLDGVLSRVDRYPRAPHSSPDGIAIDLDA